MREWRVISKSFHSFNSMIPIIRHRTDHRNYTGNKITFLYSTEILIGCSSTVLSLSGASDYKAKIDSTYDKINNLCHNTDFDTWFLYLCGNDYFRRDSAYSCSVKIKTDDPNLLLLIKLSV